MTAPPRGAEVGLLGLLDLFQRPRAAAALLPASVGAQDPPVEPQQGDAVRGGDQRGAQRQEPLEQHLLHLGETCPLSQGVQEGKKALRIRYINGMEVRKQRPRGFKKRPRGFK
jgi:hypothetical protein